MKRIFWLLMMIGLLSGTGFGQELTADEIVAKANMASYYAGDNGKSDVVMTITDSQGRERKREFRILRLDVEDGGEQKFYVYFQKPADVSKMVFMVWKHLAKDDDRWLYLPALDLVRRIAASDKRSSFVGSHFVYEDVSGRSTDADVHELVETTQDRYVIKNTPKDMNGVDFATYAVWIDRENFMPMKIEYYDHTEKLLRQIETLEVDNIQGYPTVTKSVAKDFVRGGETVNEFTNVEYDIGLTEDIFEERYLRRPPVKWIR